jgi:hypothetical protein
MMDRMTDVSERTRQLIADKFHNSAMVAGVARIHLNGSSSLRVIVVWLDRWDGECAGGP